MDALDLTDEQMNPEEIDEPSDSKPSADSPPLDIPESRFGTGVISDPNMIFGPHPSFSSIFDPPQEAVFRERGLLDKILKDRQTKLNEEEEKEREAFNKAHGRLGGRVILPPGPWSELSRPGGFPVVVPTVAPQEASELETLTPMMSPPARVQAPWYADKDILGMMKSLFK